METVIAPSYAGYEGLVNDLLLSWLETTAMEIPEQSILMIGSEYECFRFLQVNNFRRDIYPFKIKEGRLCYYGSGMDNPAYCYSIGMRVKATDTAIYVAGTVGTIIDYDFHCGYHRYLVRFDCDSPKSYGHWCRHQDIFPAGA